MDVVEPSRSSCQAFTFAYPSDYLLLRSVGSELVRKMPRPHGGPAPRRRWPEVRGLRPRR
jgi:hypothetical protein